VGVRRDGWGGEIDMVVSGLGGVGQICWVCGWIWRGWAVDRGGGAEGWNGWKAGGIMKTCSRARNSERLYVCHSRYVTHWQHTQLLDVVEKGNRA
jgi:hypothetical protein